MMITADTIVSELNDDYFSDNEENDFCKSKIKTILDTLLSDVGFHKQLEEVEIFLKKVWDKYHGEYISEILAKFPRIQQALFGLEEDQTTGGRYRDHYVHMFNVFITGARIISQIIRQSEQNSENVDEVLASVFRVESESKDNLPDSFPTPYSSVKRLFYLWAMISTFHDIGIPVEHLEKIKVGLNQYYKYFNSRIESIVMVQDNSLLEQVGEYIDHMANFHEMSICQSNGLYEKASQPNGFIKQCLLKEFALNDHGVISAICLFNSVIQPALSNNLKYDLSIEQFNKFMQNVVFHDIARAGIAISLHNIKKTKYPALFPIDPEKLPLAFLLILCDEVQESFRKEGISLEAISNLNSFPTIEVIRENGNIRIKMMFSYESLNEEKERKIVDSYKNHLQNELKGQAKFLFNNNDDYSFEKIVEKKWREGIFKTLEEKLKFSSRFSVTIKVAFRTGSSIEHVLVTKPQQSE